ncbi:MAG TPA: hypothetical protein VGP62_24485 [Bryobacteraceae bacterium]|jgi:hypothetical protein|nr:hypothetical protein [Bryobacteraceae bacterium]
MSASRLFPIQVVLWSVVLVAVAAASAYLAYELVVAPRRALENQLREQKETIAKLEQDKQRLEAYLKILKHIDRRARVEVLRQANDQQGNLQTTIRFTETDDTGKPINASRELTLPGQEVYFDTLVIKFDDHFVEQGDPLKGQALMLFRRIFSSTMRAEDGFVIDKDGQVPEIYTGRQAPSGFEKDLWKRFWEIANDEKLAKDHGVRAIHGDAPYMRLESDRVYEICLRSTGEVVITPGTRLAPSASSSIHTHNYFPAALAFATISRTSAASVGA